VPPFKREAMYRYVAQKAQQGAQTYVVCPLVEETDEILATSAEGLYELLTQGALKGVSTELLHGRMSGEQKQAVLERFRRGETSVLISTTVIEVGVDVPNATIMIVESAQRFGLAQLHQLRGRVGRGSQRAECYLCVDREQDADNDRLRALTQWTDGFRIAMEDLEQRGPGAFLGVEQSGMGELSAMTAGGLETMELGQTLAKTILKLPPEREERQRLVAYVEELLADRLRDIALN